MEFHFAENDFSNRPVIESVKRSHGLEGLKLFRAMDLVAFDLAEFDVVREK